MGDYYTLGLHTNSRGSSRQVLGTLTYINKDTFIEVHHELIPRVLSQSILGAIVTRKVKFPRNHHRKSDKRARRKDKLHTIDEVSAQEAEQQREHNARRSSRRVTMGVTSSPFAPIPSSDDSDDSDESRPMDAPSSANSSSSDDSSESGSDSDLPSGAPTPGHER